MTQPPAPGPAPDRTAPPAPRPWSDGARYGASLVATLLGAYLLATAPLGQFIQAAFLSTSLGIEYTVLMLARFVTGVLVLAIGFAIAPTSIGRRATAGSLAIGAGLLLAVLTGMRLSQPMPGPVLVWQVALHPFFVATLVATAGWLLVRARPAVTFVLLVPLVLVGLIPMWFALGGFPSAASELVVTPLALALGVGIAWLAAAIARGMRG